MKRKKVLKKSFKRTILLLIILAILFAIKMNYQIKPVEFQNESYKLVRVLNTKNGYFNEYLKSGSTFEDWDELISVSTLLNVENHKNFVESTEKMIKGQAKKTASDYQKDYSMLMFCLDSKAQKNIECAYMKVQNKNNTTYMLQYTKRFSIVTSKQKTMKEIENTQENIFAALREMKIPDIIKKLPTKKQAD